MDTLTIIIVVVVVVVALAQWRKKPKAELSKYTPERVMEIRIRLLGAWKYNALVKRKEKVIVIQNLGGMVTVNGKYIGAVEDAARKILREHGWEPGMWKLEVYYLSVQ